MNRPFCLPFLLLAFLVPSTGSAQTPEPKKGPEVSAPPTATPKKADASTKALAKKPKPRKKPKPVFKKVDVNNASKDELKTLPGVTDEYAAKIIAGRPYRSKAALGADRIVPMTVYFLIKDRVEAGVPSPKK